jgi:hypothetical protein
MNAIVVHYCYRGKSTKACILGIVSWVEYYCKLTPRRRWKLGEPGMSTSKGAQESSWLPDWALTTNKCTIADKGILDWKARSEEKWRQAAILYTFTSFRVRQFLCLEFASVYNDGNESPIEDSQCCVSWQHALMTISSSTKRPDYVSSGFPQIM